MPVRFKIRRKTVSLLKHKPDFVMAATIKTDKFALLEKAVQTIIHSQDEGLLAELKAVLGEDDNGQTWDGMGKAQQQAVLEAETQADEEEGGLTHEKAMKQLFAQRIHGQNRA